MGPSVSTRKENVLVPKWGEFESMTRVYVSAMKEALWVLLGTQYGSQCQYERGDCFGPKRGEFGSMTGVYVSAKKEAVWVLLGTQYGSQCAYKGGECFGPKEGGIWVYDKGLCECKERGCVGLAGDVIWVPV
jgi:hypothetical protein